MQFRIDSQVLNDLDRANVRVVSRREDPYEGLKGHDYIKARNLAPLVTKVVQTSALANDCEATK